MTIYSGRQENRATELTEADQAYIVRSRRAARRFYGGVSAGVASVLLVIGAVGGFTTWTRNVGLSTEAGLTALALRVGLPGFIDVPVPEMVEIPAGAFMRHSPETGADRARDEGPQRGVTLEAFRIGKYEVTFEEYDAFIQSKRLQKPYDGGWGRVDRPAINVSWYDAQAYAEWLSLMTGNRYRLPSEAEWEYAARAGTTTRYWWGDNVTQNGQVWANCEWCGSQWDRKQTAPVGSFKPNSWGLHDTVGNVYEWVQDCWHNSYEGAPADGWPWETGNCDLRVVRGGSWTNEPWMVLVRSADRDGYTPDSWSYSLGFRLAQD